MERHVEKERLEAEAVEKAEQALASEAFRKQRATIRRLDDSVNEVCPPVGTELHASKFVPV